MIILHYFSISSKKVLPDRQDMYIRIYRTASDSNVCKKKTVRKISGFTHRLFLMFFMFIFQM